ncbi:PIN domain-containing protein [Candidatus Woesearchaeota archaeon]|nr:PIN domain-containing protein [Candidatus Woesearchaeota archaeon]
MYLLDTDIIIEYLRGNKKVIDRLISLSYDELYTTTISLAELFYGIYQSSKKEKNTQKLADFLSNIAVLNIGISSCKLFGKLKSELKNKGELIDNFDLFIASICITNNLILITNNDKHFRKITNLRILNII